MSWDSARFPARRAEAHYGDRVVECFTERPRHFYQLLSDTARLHPDKEGLIFADKRLSWADLDRECSKAAAALVAQGISRGDRVGMLMANSIEFITVLFALARLGAISVPISIRSSQREVAYIVEDSEASLLLYDEALAAAVPSGEDLERGEGKVNFRALAITELTGEGPLPDEMPDEEDVAFILYTSGTTGRPKGAMLTHLNIVHTALYYTHAMGMSATDRVIATVPLTHVTGIAGVVSAPLSVGATIILMDGFKAQLFLDCAEKERMTYTIMVPAMYNLCLLQPDFAKRDLGNWRLAAYGGAPMPEPTIRRLSETLPGLSFANCYGSTETIVPQLTTPQEFAIEKREYVGAQLPGTRCCIMDEHGVELPRGEVGELWLTGPTVVKGYWRNPKATAEAFCGGYWKSGDIGIMEVDGFVKVLDRAKDMINRGGLKIYSAELESVLTDHPAVVEAAAIGSPCEVLGERVHAVVVVRSELDAEELRAFCKARLSDYKVPETVTITVEPLPRNANGKVDKKILRETVSAA